MTDLQADLKKGAYELIHIPGYIQSHGFLIAIDKSGIICFLSENICSFMNCTAPDFLGKSLQSLQFAMGSAEELDDMLKLLTNRKNSITQNNPYRIVIAGSAYHLIISTSGEYFLLEFEPFSSSAGQNIQKCVTVPSLKQSAAKILALS